MLVILNYMAQQKGNRANEWIAYLKRETYALLSPQPEIAKSAKAEYLLQMRFEQFFQILERVHAK